MLANVEGHEENAAIISLEIVKMESNGARRADRANDIENQLGREWVHVDTTFQNRAGGNQ